MSGIWCVIWPPQTENPLLGQGNSAQEILRNMKPEELQAHPQLILKSLEALYTVDKNYELIVQLGPHLDGQVTTGTPERIEILAKCALIYTLALHKLLDPDADYVFDLVKK